MTNTVERIERQNDYTCTPREAAVMLGVDYTTVIYYIHKGYLPAKRPDNYKNYVIRLDDLNEFERNNPVPNKRRTAPDIKPLTVIKSEPEEIVIEAVEIKEEDTMAVKVMNTEETVFEHITAMIEKMKVELPTCDMTVSELQGWLNGYAVCQKEILAIINDIAAGNV